MLKVTSDDTPDQHEDRHSMLLVAKQSTGLDAGQVIRWRSWHRWTAICLLACIYLAVAAHQHRARQAHQRWHAHAETTP
jgi:hypothetical protein